MQDIPEQLLHLAAAVTACYPGAVFLELQLWKDGTPCNLIFKTTDEKGTLFVAACPHDCGHLEPLHHSPGNLVSNVNKHLKKAHGGKKTRLVMSCRAPGVKTSSAKALQPREAVNRVAKRKAPEGAAGPWTRPKRMTRGSTAGYVAEQVDVEMADFGTREQQQEASVMQDILADLRVLQAREAFRQNYRAHVLPVDLYGALTPGFNNLVHALNIVENIIPMVYEKDSIADIYEEGRRKATEYFASVTEPPTQSDSTASTDSEPNGTSY